MHGQNHIKNEVRNYQLLRTYWTVEAKVQVVLISATNAIRSPVWGSCRFVPG